MTSSLECELELTAAKATPIAAATPIAGAPRTAMVLMASATSVGFRQEM
jgi:hypothetical protein